jgi:flagellar biosynthesis protein FlhF
MNIKRYFAKDMRQALRQIREEQGPEAVILSTRRTPDGLEVIGALDYDSRLAELAFAGSGHGSDPLCRPAAEANENRPPEQDRFVDRLASSRTGSDGAELPDDPRVTEETSGSEAVDDEPAPDQVSLSRSVLEHVALAPEALERPPQVPSAVDGAREPQSGVKRELNELRRMLESQLSSLAVHEMARRSPERAALLQRLGDLDLAPALARKLAEDVEPIGSDPAIAWRRALGLLSHRVRIAGCDPTERGVVALVGPTGAGKTTTLAKLAARHAMRYGPEQVAMITADEFRVGAQEQLFTYGRMLNVPVYAAQRPEELTERIRRLARTRLVLVDTGGVGGSEHALERLLAMTSTGDTPIKSLLTLAANAQVQSLHRTFRAFAPMELHGVVVTKLDEAVSLGGLISALVEHGLPAVFTTDGQDVPEHLRRASARNLVRRAADLAETARESATEGPTGAFEAREVALG